MGGTQVIPAGTGRVVPVAAGRGLRLTNTHGSQVVDAWAFRLDEPDEYLSVEQTRRMLLRLRPGAGDVLYSNRRNEMIVLAEDTAPGGHDTLIAACDAWVYEKYGFAPGHANCRDNFHTAAAAAGLAPPLVPNPLNLWMNVPVSADGRLALESPLSRPGDHVLFRPLVDVIMLFSACPADVLGVNGPDNVPCDVAWALVD